MHFEIIEAPHIQWRTTGFKEKMALDHGWSEVGWVGVKKRFRLFWDNDEHVMKLKDNCGGRVCTIPSGVRRPAQLQAQQWVEEKTDG